MSTRVRAIFGCALLLALAACSRRLPAPAPDALAEASSAPEASQPVELAGGPPTDAPPPSDAPAAADQSAALSPPAAAPDASPDPGDAMPVQVASEPDPGRRPDPLEPMNRRLYALDSALDRAVHRAPKLASPIEPHVKTAAKAVRNVLANLDEPSVAANDLLQRKVGKALSSAVRFVINSTIGVAGIADVANHFGLHHHDNDADRTLAKYGAPAGPYLYVPVAGPTTLRAVIGSAAESYLYPPHWLRLAASIGAAIKGAGYAKMAQGALDYSSSPKSRGRDGYQTTRNAYLDARAGGAGYANVATKQRATTLASATRARD